MLTVNMAISLFSEHDCVTVICEYIDLLVLMIGLAFENNKSGKSKIPDALFSKKSFQIKKISSLY